MKLVDPDVRRRRIRTTVLVALTACGIVAAFVAATSLIGGEDRRPPRGPLTTMRSGSQVWYGLQAPRANVGGMTAPVGTRVSDGLMGHLRFATKAPVTITGVSVSGHGQSLRFLGARVVPTPRGGFPYHGFDLVEGFPRPIPSTRQRVGKRMDAAIRKSIPAEGAVLQPARIDGRLQQQPMLLIGYEVVSEEFAIRDYLQLDYQVRGVDYRARLPLHFMYCPAGKPIPEACV